LCIIGAIADGFCGPGRTYDKGKNDSRCVGGTCNRLLLDDVQACCRATTGAQCSAIAPTPIAPTSLATATATATTEQANSTICNSTNAPTPTSFCVAGTSYDPNKACNQCVGDTCSSKNVDDINACCTLNKGAACSTIASVPGFCGLGSYYNPEASLLLCAGENCSSRNASDIMACCLQNTGATCSSIANTPFFCGIGMRYDANKHDRLCVGDACSSDNADDVEECCVQATTRQITRLLTTKQATSITNLTNSLPPGTVSASAKTAWTAAVALTLFHPLIS